MPQQARRRPKGWFYLVIGCLALLCPACQAQSAGPQANAKQELTVFAAASLTEAFSEIGKQFEASHPGIRVLFNFAGSQQLAQQISQGARADVFASADEAKMAGLVEAGLVEPGYSFFAANQLVVIFPADNPAGLTSLESLANPGVRIVLAAKEVPAGHYAQLFLEKISTPAGLGPGYEAAVMANVVSYEENVRAVLSKVRLGEADAGIVYATDYAAVQRSAAASGEAPKLGLLEIPAADNIVAMYPMGRLIDSQKPELAQDFIDYILSEEGRQILAGNGFLAPGKK